VFPTSAEENKGIAERVIEEVWNKGNLGTFDEVFAADLVNHNPFNTEVRTAEDYRAFISTGIAAFPELHYTIEDMIAEGDKVAFRFVFTGTHEGEMGGIPRTGKHVTMTGMTICRCEGGKIPELWANWDGLGYLQQLGLIPPLGESQG
jgi:steroid delta-isomerase-like uncharacterized protein